MTRGGACYIWVWAFPRRGGGHTLSPCVGLLVLSSWRMCLGIICDALDRREHGDAGVRAHTHTHMLTCSSAHAQLTLALAHRQTDKGWVTLLNCLTESLTVQTHACVLERCFTELQECTHTHARTHARTETHFISVSSLYRHGSQGFSSSLSLSYFFCLFSIHLLFPSPLPPSFSLFITLFFLHYKWVII